MLWPLLMLMVLLSSLSACASRGESKIQETDTRSELPEVRRITFRGNKQFWSWTLRKVMATKARPLLQPWKRGDPYDPETLKADMLRLRKYYFDRGFLNTTANIVDVQEDTQTSAVSIEIAIDEGPATVVESVRIAGTVPPELPSQQVSPAKLSLQSRDRLNKEDFDKSKSQLVSNMQNAGFARAEVIPDTKVDTDTHAANVAFTLRPGDFTSFGRVTITGAKRVPEYVLRREITVQEGEPYSVSKLRDSQKNLRDLGMFRAVTARVGDLEETIGPVDVDFEVIERKPRTIELGIGASSLESVRYSARWIHRNIFGEAEQLSVLAKVSGIIQGLEAELIEPYFLSRDNAIRHKLFVINNARINTSPFGLVSGIFSIVDPFPAYDFVTFGGQSLVEHDFTEKFLGIVGLELTSTNFYNIDLSADPETLEGAEDNTLFTQFAGLEWDKRDSDLDPTQGVLLKGRFDHSSKALISDVSFAKLTLEGRHALALGRTVLATRLKLGGIEPYGGSEDVPSNVRFFAGGAGSVRGFALNRLGPLDSDGNPIGGNSLIEGSVEVRFPLVKSLGLGGATFVDFGNVFEPAFTYRLDDLRYAAGGGIRYDTPVGPLRVDLAFVIDERKGDRTAPFYFGIGQAF